MNRALLAFELRFHARQPATIAAAGILLLLGFALARTHANSSLDSAAPWLIAYSLGILSLGSVLVAAVLTGNAALRDRDSRMAPIIHSTGISRFDLLISRFAGLLVVMLAVYGLAALGMAAGLMFGMESQRPLFRPILDLLRTLLILVVPNALVSASVLFTVAVMTRSSAATWVSGVALYILYFAGSLIGNSPLMAHSETAAVGELRTALLLDPYGLIAFLDETRLWSDQQRNTLSLPVTGNLLINRLFWVGISVALLAGLVRLYDIRFTIGPRKRSPVPAEIEPVGRPRRWRRRPIRTGPLAMLWPATMAQAGQAMRGAVFRIPFVVLLLLWSAMVAIELFEAVSRGQLGVPMQPTSALIATVLIQPMGDLGWLVVAFFAAEAAWQGQRAGIQPVVDATPAPEVAGFFGHLMALIALIGVLIAASVAWGLAMQTLIGYDSIDALRYAGLFYYAGLPLLLFGAVCLLVNRLVPNRYVGVLVSLTIPVGMAVINALTGLDDTILGRSFFPEYIVSEMVARPFHADAFDALAVFWTAVVVLMTAVAFARFRAGRFRLPAAAGALALMALVISHGAFVLARISSENPSRFHSASMEWAAEYERRYGRHADLPVPEVDSVDLTLALFPEQRRYHVEGELKLVHRGSLPIERVLVGLPVQDRREGRIDIDGAVLERFDEHFGMGWYRFHQPLQPGDDTRMHFSIDVDKSGFARLDPENYVTPEAAYIELDKWVPFVGYSGRYEIDEAPQRGRAGLAAKPASGAVPVTDGDILLDLEVSTEAGHLPVTLGVIESSQLDGRRRTVRYRSVGRVPNRYAVASAGYRRQIAKHEGIVIDQYLHPAHTDNLEEMLAGARASLDFHARNIGSYPDRNLRITVLPSFSDAFGGTSYPGSVFLVENRTLQSRMRGEMPVNPAYTVAAHEVAHQWWGRQLRPADGPGYRFLTESLATWAELEIVRDRLGDEVADDYLARMRNAYFRLRGAGATSEAPLVTVENDPAVFYFKGAHALHVIGERLGRERLRAVFRRFFSDNAGSRGAQAADLASRIVDAAPGGHRKEVRELLGTVTTYDIAIESASTRPEQGGYVVEGIMRAVATRIDSNGAQSTFPAERTIEIELMDPEGRAIGSLRRLQAVGDRTRFRWNLSERPVEIVLDPTGALLDSNRSDNVYRISERVDQ